MRALPAFFVMLAIVVAPALADPPTEPVVDPTPPVLNKIADQLNEVGVEVLLDHDTEAGRNGPSFTH